MLVETFERVDPHGDSCELLGQLRVDIIFESADLNECVADLRGEFLCIGEQSTESCELIVQLRVTWQIIEFLWVGAQTYLKIVDSDVISMSIRDRIMTESLEFNLVDSCDKSNLKVFRLLPLISAEVMKLKCAVKDVAIDINFYCMEVAMREQVSEGDCGLASLRTVNFPDGYIIRINKVDVAIACVL